MKEKQAKRTTTEGEFTELGGQNAVKVWVRGEITCCLQHVNGQESLCLWRTNRANGDSAAIIGVHKLGLYFGESGFPTPEGMRRVEIMKRVMGYRRMEAFASRKILDAIYESLHELIHLVPQLREPLSMDGVEKVILRANGDEIYRLG